jgi:PSP1 C-terminal conserved region
MQDEVKALQLCQNKVRQKKLPMDVVDAEYQWRASFSYYERPCLLIFAAGIDANSLFTSLLRSGSTSENWYENCFGARFFPGYLGQLQVLTYHLGCTKRGSGWHRSRAPLGWNSSDQLPSLSPPSLLSLLKFSSIPSRPLYSRALITVCLPGISPCVRISACGAIFHPYSNFWTIAIFPLKRAVQ